MIRLIVFLITIVVALAAIFFFLGDQPGGVTIDTGTEATTISVWLATSAILLLGAAVSLVLGTLVGFFKLPGKIGKSRKQSKTKKANAALADGLLAVEAGDRALALKMAKKAANHAEDERLKLLLEARAAEADDDWAGAERAWGQLTRLPGGQLAGLRGSAAAASERGDITTAETLAMEALTMKSNADWPFQSLFDLHCSNGAWEKALETLKIGEKRKLVSGDSLRRRRAVLKTAHSLDLPSEQKQAAQKALAEAIKLAPSFAPAAWYGAKHLYDDKKYKAAQGILEIGWKARPHPALAQMARRISLDATPNTPDKALNALISANSGHRESKILSAQLSLEKSDWVGAIKTLARLVEENPTGRLCMLMQKSLAGYGDASEADRWGRMAASASREPDWSDLDPKGKAFNYETRDWARMVYSFGDVGELVHPRYEQFGKELEVSKQLALPAPETDEIDTSQLSDDVKAQPLDYVAKDD